MKRTKKQANSERRYSNPWVAGSATIALAVSVLLFVTTFPRYAVEGNEVTHYTRNVLFGFDTPVSYVWIVVGFVAVFISSIVYLGAVRGFRNPVPKAVKNTFVGIIIASFFIGLCTGIALPISNGIAMKWEKAEAIADAYTKGHKSSPAVLFDNEEDNDAFDSLVNEIKNGPKSKKQNRDLIDTMYYEENGEPEYPDYLYKVMKKEGKNYLIGVLKGSENIKDAVEIGEISETQAREFSALTHEPNW